MTHSTLVPLRFPAVIHVSNSTPEWCSCIFGYNKPSPSSCVSEWTAAERNLQVLHGHCSASVTVPTVNSYFTSIIDFTVVSHLEYDAVLSADGLDYVRLWLLALSHC